MSATDTEACDLAPRPAHQSNVFSAWLEGHAAALADREAYTERAFLRGRADARAADRLSWLIACGGLFIAGLVLGILAFA